MSETASIGELERIAQAIALADGFQLLVLECEPLPPDGLQRLLSQVSERVAELRGEPPQIVTYPLQWFIARREPLIEVGDVSVMDGTVRKDDLQSTMPDESFWRFVFRRLNERRNAIMRAFSGTMILAMASDVSRLFVEEAPDMASIRSGMFHIDAAMLGSTLRSATERVARQPPPRELSANDQLQELLLHLFGTNELYQFVRYNFPEVALPDNVSPSSLSLAVVDRLAELGRIDRSLFERLARVRPDHRDEIDEVARVWGEALTPPSARAADLSIASDLHERLLALTSSQREAVMYLAGFAGDGSANEARALRMRPPTSARELLGRARSEGPEALARLADAIELVTARG
jgi:hypothetical protein